MENLCETLWFQERGPNLGSEFLILSIGGRVVNSSKNPGQSWTSLKHPFAMTLYRRNRDNVARVIRHTKALTEYTQCRFLGVLRSGVQVCTTFNER
jgi:hypothetical protein